MNFAQMLMTPVIPLSEMTTERLSKRRSAENLKLAASYRHGAALERYKEVMGTEWTRTNEIERRLGMVRASCNKTLKGWEKEGLIEMRKTGGEYRWAVCKGYEWRFVK